MDMNGNDTTGKGAVDWSKPIEAVREDGTVPAVANGGKSATNGCYWLTLGGKGHWVSPSWPRIAGGWSLRNVAVSRQSDVPEHPTPTQYAPELVERMVALVRTMSLACPIGVKAMGDGQREAYETACSIVSDLPQEVDPDEEEARAIIAGFEIAPDDDVITRAVQAGIARGRQLQRGEAA